MNWPIDFKNKVLHGHTLEVIKEIPNNVIDTIITSPPYWGQRDYGKLTYTIWDGDKNCEHKWGKEITTKLRGSFENANVGSNKKGCQPKELRQGKFCLRCGAWHGQLGLEPTLNLYHKHLLLITAELKRILKPTGVMFWNHNAFHGGPGKGRGSGEWRKISKNLSNQQCHPPLSKDKSITPKCLDLQNYRLAIRMIDDQKWTMRNDIIWHKRNNMPGSQKDRFTVTKEPIFYFTKTRRVYFNIDAIRIPHANLEDYTRHAPFNYRIKEAKRSHFGILGVRSHKEELRKHDKKGKIKGAKYQGKWKGNEGYLNKLQQRINDNRAAGIPHDLALCHPLGKNPGDVWSILTRGFTEEYCSTCEKILKNKETIIIKDEVCCQYCKKPVISHFATFPENLVIPLIESGCPHPGIVLDPFAGKGTVGIVAKKLGRDYLLIDINPHYVAMASKFLKAIPKSLFHLPS